MEYNIFVYSADNKRKSLREEFLESEKKKTIYPPDFLELRKFSDSISRINVASHIEVYHNESVKSKLLQFIEQYRGLKAVVKMFHPEATQTNFGLKEGEYVFSEALFPPIFFDDKQKIVDMIKGIQTREDYLSTLEYFSYSKGLVSLVNHSIINRGRLNEFKDLISINFLRRERIAYVMDDFNLYKEFYAKEDGGDKMTMREGGGFVITYDFAFGDEHLHIPKCNSVNILTGLINEGWEVPSDTLNHVPFSEEMKAILGRYNISEGKILPDYEIYRAIYANDLEAFKECIEKCKPKQSGRRNERKEQDYSSVYNLRFVIYNHTSPEFVEFCRQKLSSPDRDLSREMFF